MTTTSTSAMGGIVRRKEDPALIAGQGRYVDDIKLNVFPEEFDPQEDCLRAR